MTREEAIRIAQGLITNSKCESDTMVDFCNTVIKALEQEPCDCDDFFSREERLKMLMETGEFDFMKDIPPDKIWKLVFMLKFIGGAESEE